MIAQSAYPQARTLLRRCFSTAAAPSLQAITYARYGAPKNVLQAKMQAPDAASPKASQVVIEMLYAPISPSDLSTIKGLGASLPPVGKETVAGHEGVGVVKEVGSDVSGVKAGQMVVPTKPGMGTWSRKMIADESEVAVVPAEVPAEQIASVLSGGACAIRLISDLDIRAGETVVLDNANGHLGLPFVKVASKRGVKVLCITNDSVDYASTVESLTNAGALAVVDERFAEDEAFQTLLDHQVPKFAIRTGASAASGRIVSNAISKTGGKVVLVDGSGPLPADSTATVEKWDLGASIASSSPQEILTEVGGLISEAGLKQKVEIVGFEQFDSALNKALTRSVDGSVLLKF